jgi:hypothetical protein
MADYYEDIRDKIEANGGAEGAIGSFNHKGGDPFKMTYQTPSGNEEHHVVPYLIGFGHDGNDAEVKMLLAWKYKGNSAHPGAGFRCYKVSKIKAFSENADTPPSVPQVKINKQKCVETW